MTQRLKTLMPTMPEATFEHHRAQVYAWAYRLLQNHHDALDVTQEVFLKWWRAHATADAPTNAIGWLRRVTVNLAIDTIRCAARRAQTARGGPAPADQQATAAARRTHEPTQRETARRIAAALHTLTEPQRAVVVAKVYDGCTFARIAEQMGISLPTAKTHYLRALQALRHRLRGLRPAGTDNTQPPARAAPSPSQPGDRHEL